MEKPVIKISEICRLARVNEEIVIGIVKDLEAQGLISILNEEIRIIDKVGIALLAIMNGADPERTSIYLSWQDFETLVSKELTEMNIEVIKNLKLKYPKPLEIDIIGIDVISKLCYIIDCKHWSPGYSKKSKLMKETTKHLERVKLFADVCEWIIPRYNIMRKCKYFVPIIITLTDPGFRAMNGCIIVPILTLRSFITESLKYLEELRAMFIKNRCYVS